MTRDHPRAQDLKFLSADGTPTKRYHDYRDKSRSKQVLGEALREAYEDIFHIKEHPSETIGRAIVGRFKSVHNASDTVAERQALTFLALLKLADITGKAPKPPSPADAEKQKGKPEELPALPFAGLRYNIEIHLPATKDVEVYNAIFQVAKGTSACA